MLNRLPLIAALLSALCLTACAERSVQQAARLQPAPVSLPPMKAFRSQPQPHALRNNADMARDFMELTFRMESGRSVPNLSRFEGPVRLVLAGPVPPSAAADADQLIARLRREAHIDIQRVGDPAAANLVVQFVTVRQMHSRAPRAACFVVPNATGWEDYLQNRRSDAMDWTLLDQRRRAAVFIPADTNPQEIRDCLHEEVAQALGPLNDLYRLSDSVFNDDNFHTVLTGFDMLMLRATYDPALRSGMSEAEVQTAIRPLLDRLNPAGRKGQASPAPGATPRDWISAIETTMGPRGSEEKRRTAAAQALSIAQRQGWTDARLAFSHFTYARLAMPVDPESAVISLLTARQIYDRLPDARIHAAHVDMQLAAIGLAAGEPEETLALVDHRLGDVQAAENAALLATLLMMKAEALAQLGHDGQAEAIRLDSLGWARYGFGDDEYVIARLAEVASLQPETGVEEFGG